ncbi:MAG: hypothetical protein H6898_08490 [Rhodobacter sp.]|nr:hypothetical protein [Paracoccaceae bacterium]MCC0076612.1 hypothetical protein [Rhodobacter sp.]
MNTRTWAAGAILAAAVIGWAGVSSAEDGELMRIGADAFGGGRAVDIDGAGIDDVAAGGGTVDLATDVSGSVHLLGRRVTVEGAVGGDLYAGGMEVRQRGAVAGDVTAMGYSIETGSIGGDLRVWGSSVIVGGPVAGYALLAGDEVRIDGVIAGDARIAARTLDFGPEARVEGVLTLLETDDTQLSVRDGIAARVEHRRISGMDEALDDLAPSPAALVWGFVRGVLVVTVLAALLAALLPGPLAGLRHRVLDQPLRSLWIGAMSVSVLIGGAVVAGLTLIGILAVPFLLLFAALLGFLGYVVGVYALGVSIVNRAGRGMPDGFGDRALAALAGALAAAVVALIPVLGWLFALGLALAGVGAMAIAWANPRFFAA